MSHRRKAHLVEAEFHADDGTVIPARALCGLRAKLMAGPGLFGDPFAMVTCGRCRRTKRFRSFLTKAPNLRTESVS